MNTDNLMDAIGMIDGRFVADAHSPAAAKRSISRGARFAIAMAAALSLLFAASFSAVAAGSDTAYRMLYSISPEIAQLLKPVSRSCEDEGIRMEVIAADVTGSEAYIYISMEDMTGERIDGTIDLFDAYEINRNFDCAAGCERIDYDEQTGKAIFLIHMQSMDGSDIERGKITFSVWKFLSNKEVIEEVLPVDLSQVGEAEQTRKISPDLFRGEMCTDDFLAPQEGGVYTPGKGAQITAMGYIGGRLHIQVRYDDMWRTDNHGWVWLEDENGNRAECEEYQFWCGERTERISRREVFQGYEDFCQEFIFDIPPEELSQYRLHGDFMLCDTLVEGDWQVTFPLEN